MNSQEASGRILGSLTDNEKSVILNEQRYLDYMEVYGNDTDAVLEEFLADTLAGMSRYTKNILMLYQNFGTVWKTLTIIRYLSMLKVLIML